jgi:hypothetical protein
MPVAPLDVRRRYLIVVSRSLPAAPLDVRRRYLIVVPRLLPRCALQVLGRCPQAAARGATRCASQVLDRGAQVVFRSAVRCASHIRSCLIAAPRPLPELPLAVYRRYLIVVPELYQYCQLHLHSSKLALAAMYF